MKSYVGKDPFKVPERPMDFNVREYENFIDRVSDSALLLVPLKSYYLMRLGVVSNKNIHNHLKKHLKYSFLFQLHICIRLDFLTKQHMVTMSAEDNVRLQLAFIKLDIAKQTCKNVKQCHSSH